MRFLIYGIAALVIFTVFVTVFAASAERSEVRNLPKWAWVLLCIFVTPAGGLLYLALGRPKGEPKRKTVAPDDDPEFLRKLRDQLRDKGDDDA